MYIDIGLAMRSLKV